MATRIGTVLTLLLVACGGDGGDGRSSDDNILHLHGVDVSEADFKSDLSADSQAKAALCSLAGPSQEDFVNDTLHASEELLAQSQRAVFPTPSTNETPRPGQKVDRDSAERVYAVLKEIC
jgi:hypothetical protein